MSPTHEAVKQEIERVRSIIDGVKDDVRPIQMQKALSAMLTLTELTNNRIDALEERIAEAQAHVGEY